MRPLYSLIALTFLVVLLFSVSASSAGTGVKVYAPSVSSVRADILPFSYNGSFIVMNDGLLEGVYVIRVAVDDPAAITWINVSPSGFALAPGETRIVEFSLNINVDQAIPGTYHIIFMPTRLPANVEPYLDTFASYVSEVDSYNLTVEIPEPVQRNHSFPPGRGPWSSATSGTGSTSYSTRHLQAAAVLSCRSTGL